MCRHSHNKHYAEPPSQKIFIQTRWSCYKIRVIVAKNSNRGLTTVNFICNGNAWSMWQFTALKPFKSTRIA